MPKYMTKQRKALLAFLEQHADEELSARQIEQALCGDGISISAVYRNLSELQKERKVRKVTKSDSREVYYLYTDCDHCKECLKKKNKKCGKTYHMNSEGAQMLVRNLAQSDEFAIDKADTVLYGVCRDCQKKHEE